jgi:hypothetical protein
MEDTKLSVRPASKFKGLADKWPEWRDQMEAFFRGVELYPAIQAPRPDAPYPPPPPGVGAGGEGGGAGGGGAGAGVAPPPVGPNLQELWDRRSAKIYMYLQLYTDGIARSVVSQFRATGNGVEAWAALARRFDPQGQLGKSMVYRKISAMRWGPETEPEAFFLELERLCTRLEEMGEAYGEARMIGTIMEKLPREMYRPLIAILDKVG